jgi:hypothetical protein
VQVLTAASVSSKLGLENDELDSYDPASTLAATVNSYLAAEEESSDIILLQVVSSFCSKYFKSAPYAPILHLSVDHIGQQAVLFSCIVHQ